MSMVSVTRLRLRAARYVLPFLWYALRSHMQARRAAGNIGVMLRTQGRVYWTMTLWRDRQAVKNFMRGGAHRAAMPHLPHWCDEASLVHWQYDGDALPSWETAEQRLATEGRLSAVKFASPAHTAGHTLGSRRT